MGSTLREVTVIALAAMVLGQTAGCARTNRYDGLKALPLEEIIPVVERQGNHQAPHIGIAFGGGGVRGFVHLGILRAFEEAGIRAQVVAGTSVGALAATLYASGLSAGEIESLAKSASRYELLDLVVSREGVINGQAYAAWIRAVTGNRTMRELPVPLGIAVSDLGAGKALLVIDGDPGEAVQASATVPGMVIPVQSNGRTYVDGGVLTIVPVRFTRAMGADVVIAIDIYCGKHPAPRGNALDTLLKTFRLQSCLLSDAEIAEADILIRPAFEPDNPVSFAQRDEAIMAGYVAAVAAIPALKAKIAAWQASPE
ncbi:patatin-like phospholipase family protein [Propionivibrio sp.]|uniref:patatin-like phospholipase family protein n=1 Tax=Propionivibrio sp. TaxID=2212460 RepID=UPI003BF2D2CA